MTSIDPFNFGFDIIFALFPIIFIAIFGIAIFSALRDVSKWHSNNQQPIVPSPARIVAKRTQVSGSGTHARSRTRYYTTFEFANGQLCGLHIQPVCEA